MEAGLASANSEVDGNRKYPILEDTTGSPIALQVRISDRSENENLVRYPGKHKPKTQANPILI